MKRVIRRCSLPGASVLFTGVVTGSLLLSAALPAYATPGTFTEYSIPSSNSQPFNITVGPDNNLWFTEGVTSPTPAAKIGRVTTSGTFTEFAITSTAGPDSIVAGPDGKMWFTEAETGHVGGTHIGRINTDGTGYVEFATKTKKDAGVRYITPSPDGSSNLWFTEQLANKLGKITTAGVVTEFTMSMNSQPNGITGGPDGALWVAESGIDKIARVNLSGSITNEYSLTAASQPFSITSGPDGALWFTESGTAGNKIGRITTAGVITEYSIPTASAGPRIISSGPDGALWFTEINGNNIGRITTAGVFTEYSVPTTNSQPFGITAAPSSGNSMWFVEHLGNKIGNVTTA